VSQPRSHTSATARRGDHKVHKGHMVALEHQQTNKQSYEIKISPIKEVPLIFLTKKYSFNLKK
jgi:hypothetical protein